jgi:hypothetical protein
MVNDIHKRHGASLAINAGIQKEKKVSQKLLESPGPISRALESRNAPGRNLISPIARPGRHVVFVMNEPGKSLQAKGPAPPSPAIVAGLEINAFDMGERGPGPVHPKAGIRRSGTRVKAQHRDQLRSHDGDVSITSAGQRL